MLSLQIIGVVALVAVIAVWGYGRSASEAGDIDLNTASTSITGAETETIPGLDAASANAANMDTGTIPGAAADPNVDPAPVSDANAPPAIKPSLDETNITTIVHWVLPDCAVNSKNLICGSDIVGRGRVVDSYTVASTQEPEGYTEWVVSSGVRTVSKVEFTEIYTINEAFLKTNKAITWGKGAATVTVMQTGGNHGKYVTGVPEECPLLEMGQEYLLFLSKSETKDGIGEIKGEKDVFWITFGYIGLAEVKDGTIRFQSEFGADAIKDLETARISDLPKQVQRINAETIKSQEGFGWDGIVINRSAKVSALAFRRWMHP